MISLERPQRKWASSRLEGRTSSIFSSCGRCSRVTTGTSGTSSGGVRKGQSRCELLGGLSGFFSRRCRGLRPCVDSFPEHEDSSPGKTIFPALPPLSSRGLTHTTVARGTALCESVVGKPSGKASMESHRSLDPREGKCDTAATAREECTRACPHSGRGLTPLGRLQNTPRSMSVLERNPQVPAPTPHKILSPGIDGRRIPRGPRATRIGTGLS